MDFVEEDGIDGRLLLLIITCPTLTASEQDFLRLTIAVRMPAGVRWTLIALDGPYNTPDRRAAAEAVWRLGDLVALRELVASWDE